MVRRLLTRPALNPRLDNNVQIQGIFCIEAGLSLCTGLAITGIQDWGELLAEKPLILRFVVREYSATTSIISYCS